MSSLHANASPAGIASQAEVAERIRRDLHDGAQNALVAVRIKLGLAADAAAAAGAPELQRMLVELGEDAQAALDGVRSIARGAGPPLLAAHGVADALAAEARRAAIPACVAGWAPRSTPAAEAAVFYCCTEALQNAVKHAGADAHATIRLAPGATMLAFAVEDDGAGFDLRAGEAAGGLGHMRGRVAAAGGALEIASRPRHGTSVHGLLPWPARAADGFIPFG